VLKTSFRTRVILGFVVGVLSIDKILEQALGFGLAAPLQWILDFYAKIVEGSLHWADPCLRDIINYLKDRIGIHLELYPHWKYIFVPMWFYLFADVKTMWGNQRKPSAVFFFIWGGLVALTSSVAAGTTALDNKSLLPMIFPTTGFIIYSVVLAAWDAIFHIPEGYTGWKMFRYYFIAFPLTNILMAAIILIVGFQMTEIEIPSLSLVLLIVFVVAMAFRNIAVSAVIATVDRAPGESWIHRFRAFGTQRHGFFVLAVIWGALVFAFLGAGFEHLESPHVESAPAYLCKDFA
jgi:hypothetical protein